MNAYAHGLRGELVETSRYLHGQGWVANHDGNVSVRVGKSRYLATPTAVSKGDVDESMLIVVDEKGRRVSGNRKPFSELVLHMAAYRARADVSAVIHAHPPIATAFAVAGRGLDKPIIAEAVVSLGDRIPLVPYQRPSTPGFSDTLEDALRYYDAVLLENHGVVTVGDCLEQAKLRMELVEHLARIEWHAHSIGGPQYLPLEDIEPLLEKRAKAGLGPRPRGLTEPHSKGHCAQEAGELRRVVTEELQSLLKDRRD